MTVSFLYVLWQSKNSTKQSTVQPLGPKKIIAIPMFSEIQIKTALQTPTVS